MRFIILGAGLSGLSCGVALAGSGHEVVIIEKEAEVGGLARSFRIKGYTFDYGPHFLFGKGVYDLIREKFPEIELNKIDSTKEKIYLNGRYLNFPFDPVNVLSNIEKNKVPGVLFELILKRLFSHDHSHPSQNVEDWVIQTVGRRIYDYISLGGYIKKLYGLPPTEISYEWGIQKLKFLAKWRNTNFIKLAVKSFSEKSNVKKRVIHYPPAGIDHIPIQISNYFRSLGGEIYLNSQVQSVQQRINDVSVTIKRNSEQKNLVGDFLISTIPLSHLVGMLIPAVPKEIREKVNILRYRTLLLLYLFIKRESLLKDQCIYFTEDSFFFRRITEFNHLSRNMAPEKKTSLCIEITCFDNDEIDNKDKNKIFRIVVSQLEKTGFLKERDIEGYHFLRIPFAYPVYELQSSSLMETILSQLKNYKNLVSIGRQGLFYYNAMNSSIMMSYELGEKLAASDKDKWERITDDMYQSRLTKYESKV